MEYFGKSIVQVVSERLRRTGPRKDHKPAICKLEDGILLTFDEMF